ANYWLENLLQMKYFHENVAGKAFFDRLQRLRHARNHEVVRIYFVVLALGFRGSLGARGNDNELLTLMSDIQRDLAAAGMRAPEVLSPNVGRRDEPLARSDFPKVWLWLPVGAFILAIIVYFTLSAFVSSKADAVVRQVNTLLQ